MANGRDINVRLTVRDDGTVVMKRFGRQVDQTARRSERSLNRMHQVSRRTSTAVRDLATSFGLFGGAVGAAAFILPITAAARVTNQLDVALAGVRAVSGATAAQMAELEAQARSLGAATQFSASQAAEAQEFLARAGFQVNEILAATPATLNLAAAGSLDLARAADISSNVLSAFQKESSELNNIVDIMAATTSGANTNVEQMGSAMEFVAPVAEAMNVSIQETAAGIAVLSNAGLQGQKAGTGLRRVITELADPSEKLAAAMGGLSLQSDGLVAVLRQLSGSSLDASDAMQIFGQRGGPAFNVLRAGASSAEEFAAALQDVDGAARDIAETKLDNLSGDARKLGSALAELGIKVGRSGLIEDLRSLTQSLTELARGKAAGAISRNLVPAIKELVFLLTALASARFGSRALVGLAASATQASGTVHLLSRRLNTSRGRFLLAGRAARGFGAALGLLGGPAGLAILAAFAVFRLVTAENDLKIASEAAAAAQKALNDEIADTEDVTIDTLRRAQQAQRDLVKELEKSTAFRGPLAVQATDEQIERLEKARAELAKLDTQVREFTSIDLTKSFWGPAPTQDLGRATDAVLEADSAIQRLEDGTKRLTERQANAVQSARDFAKAQQEIMRARFDADAPGLEQHERVAREREVSDEINRLQREQFDEERRIAVQAAGERLRFLKLTISDEEQIARGRLAIRQDLAKEELQIERSKFDQIKKELLASINEEKRLRQQQVDALSFADELEKTLDDAGKSDRQLRNEAELEAIRNTGQEAIDAWKRYVELGGDGRQAIREIRKEAAGMDDDIDQAGERTKTLAEEFRGISAAITDATEELRKLTENVDLKTNVTLDDSAFRAFLDELATPSEHTVRINTEQNRSEGGPILRRARGGNVPGGWGGGDRVRAMLEPGEYVIRKEAVRKYGPAWMAALNGMRIEPPPIYRRTGGPVGELPPGGAGPGQRDQVDINLSLNGERVSGTADREFAEGLARALRGLQSSVAGGV